MMLWRTYDVSVSYDIQSTMRRMYYVCVEYMLYCYFVPVTFS